MQRTTFPVLPPQRWAGASAPIKRPREIACFSYDDAHEYHPDACSLKYYYTPRVGADLCGGFERFEKVNDSTDEHLDSLLRRLREVEQEEGRKTEADVVTWRGMMTKLMSSPWSDRDGYVTCGGTCS
jgi:RAT1-interacting protein